MEQTPLKEKHEELGARMVPFGGFSMPLHYGSILEEAGLVRSRVGLFDLCHMGRFRIHGPGGERLCQKVLTNDISKIKPGAIRYALLCREDGGVLDDVLVYRDPGAVGEFFLVVNAANRGKDLDWIRSHAEGLDCEVSDRTRELAMLALQGPRSEGTLQKLCVGDLSGLGYYRWMHSEVCKIPAGVSRTGYTGEDGFEVYLPREHAGALWDALLEAGAEFGIAPIGLGARDILRLEAGMALYGNELTTGVNPFEAGLGWAVKLGTGFIGEEALAKVKEEGPRRKLVGLVVEGRRVPRKGFEVRREGSEIGRVASGGFSLALEKGIATAFLPPELAEPGSRVAVLVRGTEEPAEVVSLPFYKREK